MCLLALLCSLDLIVPSMRMPRRKKAGPRLVTSRQPQRKATIPFDPSRAWRVILTKQGQTKIVEIRPDSGAPSRWIGIIGTGVAQEHVADLRRELSAAVDALVAVGWHVLEDRR